MLRCGWCPWRITLQPVPSKMGHELFPFSIRFSIISALSSDKIHGSLSDFNLGHTSGAGFICGLNFLQASGASPALTMPSGRSRRCFSQGNGSFRNRMWGIGNARTLVLGGSRNDAELSSCARSYFGTSQAVRYQTRPREMLFAFGDMCDYMKHPVTSCLLFN